MVSTVFPAVVRLLTGRWNPDESVVFGVPDFVDPVTTAVVTKAVYASPVESCGSGFGFLASWQFESHNVKARAITNSMVRLIYLRTMLLELCYRHMGPEY